MSLSCKERVLSEMSQDPQMSQIQRFSPVTLCRKAAQSKGENMLAIRMGSYHQDDF